MSITLLDIWNFLINFNLLLIIPMLPLLFVYLGAIYAEGLEDGIFLATLLSIAYIFFLFLIFDVWLNWIDFTDIEFIRGLF